ncbi:non-ribosomal peptide synthetase [Cohnella sp. CFH 77786]|uniref:non-ribosomal peptide synthetase n=1 Tax=Cohnella sp. CFH 77786 TaxID=2662265 RepID=UPI001C60DFF5|nr:non-ribosomal peptide synthetase [Cohnella sp. CFH 77786]
MNGAAKLDRTNIEDITALTPTQEGLLYHYLSGKEDGRYDQQLSLRFSGELCMETLRAAWRHVARTNEMLRTVFRWEKLEHPVQIVLREHEIPVEERDLSAFPAPERERRLEEAREADRRERPDLTVKPFRVLVCKLDDRGFEMIVSWHHILFDGWSNAIVLKEFMQAYDAFLAGAKPHLPRKTKFKAFVAWHQQAQAERESRRSYWEGAFAGLADRALLPFEGDDGEEGEPGRHVAAFEPRIITRLGEFAKQRNVTAASVLYAVWALLLHKYGGGARDVVFGTTVSGRTPEIDRVEEMVGLFINTVPLRVTVDESASAEQAVRTVDGLLREREPYENTPLTDIVRWSGSESADELFETVVVLDNYPLDVAAFRSGNLAVTGHRMREATHYRLALGIHAYGEWKAEFEFDPSSLSGGDVGRMADHYMHLLLQVLSDPQSPVGELELATGPERERILTVFNRPVGERGTELAHRAFEAQVRATPDHPAVISDGRKFTYREIDESADRLARRLVRAGVAPDRLVALALERSADFVVAMLAVLKAGGGYIPIDVSFAPARIDYILKDSAADILIVRDGAPNVPAFEGKVISIGGEDVSAEPADAGEPESGYANSQPPHRPDQLAYVIYTSGSTGRPKGVMTEHRHLLAYVRAFQREFRLGPGDVVLQQASCSFDHFVEEVYPALLSGGAVLIARREDALDPGRLTRLIEDNGVTVVTVQPLMLAELDKRDGAAGVHTYISGGDVLKYEHVSRLVRRARVYNSYGPTEATVCATYWRCGARPLKSIPIGIPIEGYNVYVVDRRGRLQPVGIPGEICISGNGVARGYLGNRELTAGKFVPDPYRPGETMYKTGDIGVWRSDGSLRFIGRNDEQVKIRGYRIDPREIELALLEHPAVSEAVVLAVDDAARAKAIAAYVAAAGGTTARELREHVGTLLPPYMIPSFYYRITSVPRTGNDKADKQALLRCSDLLPSGHDDGGERSDTERAVAGLWREVLKLESFGVHDHFFDIGGNSLLLMQLQARLEQRFDAGISVSDLFSLPSVSKQAARLDEIRNTAETVAIADYQTLPAEFFGVRLSGRWREGLVRSRIEPALAASLTRIASEFSVERYDVLVSMWGYLFAEAAGSRTATFHLGMPDGRYAVPFRLDLDRLRDFPELFVTVRSRRKGAEPPETYRLDRVGRFVPERNASEVLPIVLREEAWAEERSDLFDLILGLGDEEEDGGMRLSLRFNAGRLLQERAEWLAESYLHLLRQLSGIGAKA